MKQKLLLTALLAALALSACDKKEPQVNETAAATHDHDHDDHDDHDHDHEGHDHEHHHDDPSYQCGDKTVKIGVHNHDGDNEMHLTVDDITYDLDQDLQNQNRYLDDEDSINPADKGMAVVLDGDKAQVTDLSGKTLLECQKQ